MRIAWVGPFAAASPVARFSRHVSERLARAVEIELWTDSPRPWQPTSLPVVAWDDPERAAHGLRRVDRVVANVGGATLFAGRTVEVAGLLPSVVVVHTGRPADDRLLRKALHHALAAVVHSDEHASLVTSFGFGPTRRLELPTPQAELPLPPAAPHGDELLLVSISMLDRRLRVEDAIRAIASSVALRERVRCVLAGPALDLRYRDELHRLVVSSGLDGVVSLPGEVPDGERDRLLAAADAFLVLRDPSAEGGSAWLAEALAYRKPVLAYETGIATELPPGTIATVAPGDIEALAQLIERVDHDRSWAATLGTAGRSWGTRNTIEGYARRMLDVVTETAGARLMLELVERVGAACVEAGVTDEELARIATLLAPLTGGYGVGS